VKTDVWISALRCKRQEQGLGHYAASQVSRGVKLAKVKNMVVVDLAQEGHSRGLLDLPSIGGSKPVGFEHIFIDMGESRLG
jgi:hypothetical protein